MESYPTRQAQKSIAPPPLNYRRGIFFLRLAIEQVRTANSASAERILKDFLEPLDSAFGQNLQHMDYSRFDHSAQLLSYQQQRHGQKAWHSMEERGALPVAPPGFGLDTLGLKEAVPSIQSNTASTKEVQHERWRNNSQSLFTLKSRVEQLNHYGGPNANKHLAVSAGTGTGKPISDFSSSSYARRNDYGPIAPPRPSNILAARKSKPSATLNPDVPAMPNLPPGWNSVLFKPDNLPGQSYRQSTAAPTHGRETKRSTAVAIPSNAGRRSSLESSGEHRGNQSSNSATSYVPRSSNDSVVDVRRHGIVFGSFQESVQPESVAEDSVNSNNRKVYSSSYGTEWDTEDDDTRAAEQVKTSEKSKNKNNLVKAPPSSWAKIAAIKPTSKHGGNPHITLTLASPTARPSLPVAPVTPKEPAAAQLRVVWLANLPSFFTLHYVSNHITEGPINSILLQYSAHETLPGLSACVIFMNATDATVFLQKNNHCPRTQKRLGPSKYARYFKTDAEPNRGSTATNPLSISDLKRKDITVVKGIPYPMTADPFLESMYSPTNARRRLKWSRTRLFYDVSMKQFKRDVYEIVGGKQYVELFHFYNPGECTVVFASVCVAHSCLKAFEEMSRERAGSGESTVGMTAGQITTLEEEGRAGGFHPGRMDGKTGRYEGVEVVYVRDFNEARPEGIWSQYGIDGRLRAASRMEGCEGLFEGPDV